MNTFSINLTDEFAGANSEYAVGKIEIDKFNEHFHASLSYWTSDQYVEQWKQALDRLIKGAETTALITSMHDPKSANFLYWWVLFRDRDRDNIHIQNKILFLDEIKTQIDEKTLYEFIREREVINEDGEKISEWDTNMEAITQFMK